MILYLRLAWRNIWRHRRRTVIIVLAMGLSLAMMMFYDGLIDVKNEGRQLMTGMTAQVFFIFGNAENATIIPAEALIRPVPSEDSEMGKAYRVSVATEAGREQRLIRIGLQTRTQAEVKEGLKAGDRVLVNRPQGNAEPANSQPRVNANRFNRGPQL